MITATHRVPAVLSLLTVLGAAGLARGQWTVTNLHPAGATDSEATCIYGGRQGGTVSVGGIAHASLWSGTAASWVDLTPAGSTTAQAYAVHAGQQVGFADRGGFTRATLWNGTAASWVDLAPVGSTYSAAIGNYSGRQVGWANFGGVLHASLWSGSAASWEDLSLALTGSWGSTAAAGIWSDETTIYVVGNGQNNATGRNEALLWTRPISAPCYANCDGSTSAPILSINDFICFQTKYAQGDSYANCDGSTQPPALNVSDFICFQTRYAQGCP